MGCQGKNPSWPFARPTPYMLYLLLCPTWDLSERSMEHPQLSFVYLPPFNTPRRIPGVTELSFPLPQVLEGCLGQKSTKASLPYSSSWIDTTARLVLEFLNRMFSTICLTFLFSLPFLLPDGNTWFFHGFLFFFFLNIYSQHAYLSFKTQLKIHKHLLRGVTEW